ncbi:insulin protein enhancer protein ISL-2 [Platysternon megacephalum]|uniref:Insulin protein enhancer protein ISL-2 n=1 Tax=Platysternon megacephalum TaxID=55544 RepID=A0A4D9E493_9SAUR|nr:insulin protein enhancer protein ISL-2 [Platysternon megacephalum]
MAKPRGGGCGPAGGSYSRARPLGSGKSALPRTGSSGQAATPSAGSPLLLSGQIAREGGGGSRAPRCQAQPAGGWSGREGAVQALLRAGGLQSVGLLPPPLSLRCWGPGTQPAPPPAPSVCVCVCVCARAGGRSLRAAVSHRSPVCSALWFPWPHRGGGCLPPAPGRERECNGTGTPARHCGNS